MGSCREILTLQLGNYSNLVGAHFWNIQEMCMSYNKDVKSQICHDVLHREGRSFNGDVTYSPRLICTGEYQQSRIPTLDDILPKDVKSPLWDDTKLETLSQEPIPHEFLKDLDSGVDTDAKNYDFVASLLGWGDILRPRLHTRSLALGPPSFENVEDQIRYFVEECDNMQGFHIFKDSSELNFYSDILSFIDDEYSSKCRISFPLTPPKDLLPWKDSATRILSSYLSLHDCGTFSSLTTPLSCAKELTLKPDTKVELPYITYDLNQSYHTSAILAAYLDTMTLSYRTQDTSNSINDTYAGLTVNGWKFSGASVNVPFPLKPGAKVKECLEERDDTEAFWYEMSPDVGVNSAWYQTFGLRGVSDSSVVTEYIRFISNSVVFLHGLDSPLPTRTPFPRIFSPHVSIRGSVDPSATRMDGFHVQSVPILAGLHACPGVGNMLKSFSSLVSKIDIGKLPFLIERDVVDEKIEEMIQWAATHSLDAEDDFL